MASESTAPAASPVAAALALGHVPSTIVSSSSNDIVDHAVPMAVVQQFIEDNKEKGMPVNQKMADLKKQAEAIKTEKKRVAKELKNEERKRQRLRAKAKQLSAEDLVQVLALRATASAKSKAKASAKAKSAPSPISATSEDVADE